MTKHSPFRYFKTSPEIIRLAVMLYVRFPLSLRNVEDLLHERGIEISHETVRFWWNRFGPMFAAEIRRNRVSRMRCNQAPRPQGGIEIPQKSNEALRRARSSCDGQTTFLRRCNESCWQRGSAGNGSLGKQ